MEKRRSQSPMRFLEINAACLFCLHPVHHKVDACVDFQSNYSSIESNRENNG